jgi:hypothetical protein
MELISHAFGKRQELLIMPVGDIQWAGEDEEVALTMLQKHIRWGVEHDVWFVGMGDYIDTFSPSNRSRLSGAQLYDTATRALDRDAEKRTRELFDRALKPSKGRWLGLLEGHHFHEFRDRTTSDQLLAGWLDAPFIGTNAYIRLLFSQRPSRGGRNGGGGAVDIWVHHGTGSSSTAGGALNRLERVAKAFDADIYMMGHQHTKDAKPLDYVRPIYPSNGAPRLEHATKLLVVTGSFLKGYVVGRRDGPVPRGGYVEQKMLNPVALGGVLVKVRPRWVGPHEHWHPDLGAEV